MSKWLALAVAFLVTPALGDDWICKEAASIRTGNAILVCGIGTADSEADAREEALRRAKYEFEEICSASADCRGRDTNVTPLRNSCEKYRVTQVRCYRGLRYEVGQRAVSGVADAPVVTAAEGKGDAPSQLVVGLDLISLGMPAFSGETLNLYTGVNVRYRLIDWLGIEAGANVDFWLKPKPVSTTGSASGIGIGYSLYGSTPVFFGQAPWYVAPEFRYFYHASDKKTALGLGAGYLDTNAGWGARLVVSDIVGSNLHPSFFVTISYLFGLL